MKKIAIFIWQKKWILIVFIIIIIVLVFLLNNKKPSKPGTTPPPTSGATWKEITPGLSTKTQVENILGVPLSENKSGNKTIDTYSSTSQTRQNEVVFNENQTTQIIKRIITSKDNLGVKDITNQYGKENIILYGPDSVNGINLYVYLDKGVAYLGNPDSDTLLEIWYFVPTTQNDFLLNYGTGYSITLPNTPF